MKEKICKIIESNLPQVYYSLHLIPYRTKCISGNTITIFSLRKRTHTLLSDSHQSTM